MPDPAPAPRSEKPKPSATVRVRAQMDVIEEQRQFWGRLIVCYEAGKITHWEEARIFKP